MKKKTFSKKLAINKETVSNLNVATMKNVIAGNDSIIISCQYYMTVCYLLTACTGTKKPPTLPPA